MIFKQSRFCKKPTQKKFHSMITTICCLTLCLLDSEFEDPLFAIVLSLIVDLFALKGVSVVLSVIYAICAVFSLLAWCQCLL